MKSAALRVLAGSVLLSAAAQPAVAGSSHRRLHSQHGGNRNHTDGHELDLVKKNKLVNRAGQCTFPEDAGLVAITPYSSNSGWAMSPDQECTAGSYCPFACPPGKLMNQWKLGTTYIYPESMYGGLYCDEDGAINKPFPSEEYCVEGMGNVKAVNNCGKTVSFCQTVLPGNENMLIPTAVDSTATLAVPGTSYWDATAAHYYINEPGYTTDEACGWGTSAKPIGNWAAYVAGANQDAMGNTYVKLGWNPIYTGDYSGVKPSFGIKIECDGDCVGQCSIDPSTDGFGGVNSLESSTGAGGADFCVVTVTSGSANIVVFNVDGSTGDKSSTSTSTAATSSSSSEAVPKETPTTTAALVVALNAKPTSSSSPPTTLSSSTSSENTTTETSTTHPSTTSSFTAPALSSSSHQASTKTANPTLSGGVFQETGGSSNRTISSAKATTLASTDSPSGITAVPEPAATTSKENHASDPRQNQAAFAGLVVAIVAAACLY